MVSDGKATVEGPDAEAKEVERGVAKPGSEGTPPEGYNESTLESRTWTRRAHNRINPALNGIITSSSPAAKRKGDAGGADENGRRWSR